MEKTSFQTRIENQFDYICKRPMEDEQKNYFVQLSKIAEKVVTLAKDPIKKAKNGTY